MTLLSFKALKKGDWIVVEDSTTKVWTRQQVTSVKLPSYFYVGEWSFSRRDGHKRKPLGKPSCRAYLPLNFIDLIAGEAAGDPAHVPEGHREIVAVYLKGGAKFVALHQGNWPNFKPWPFLGC